MSFLPEKLPQFEGLWAEQFVATNDYEGEALFAGLLVRFGTGSATGLVVQKANANGEMCSLPDTVLDYLLKFDPESAHPLAEAVFSPGVEGTPSCRFSFQNISRYATSPVLTELALERPSRDRIPRPRGTLSFISRIPATRQSASRSPGISSHQLQTSGAYITCYGNSS